MVTHKQNTELLQRWFSPSTSSKWVTGISTWIICLGCPISCPWEHKAGAMLECQHHGFKWPSLPSSSGDLVWQFWGVVKGWGNCRHGAEETHINEMSTPAGLNTSCVDQASTLPRRLLKLPWWVWGCWVGIWGHSSARGGEGARHHFYLPALPGESQQKNWPASIPPTRRSLPSHIPSLGLHPQAGGFRTKWKKVTPTLQAICSMEFQLSARDVWHRISLFFIPWPLS